MTTNVLTAHQNQTVLEAVGMMDSHDVGTVVIVEHEIPIGIFTERDVLRQIVSPGKDASKVLIKKVMSSNVISANEYMDVVEISRLMTLRHVKRMPIVNEKGKLVGIITSTDLLKIMAEAYVMKK